MNDFLTIDKNFNMLSLSDLLKARDLYHAHLIHKENVVATAIGRYLIRQHDPWPKDYKDYAKENPKNLSHKAKSKRTLSNSEVRPYSWPCVLVFVEEWIDDDQFGSGSGKVDSSEKVEKAIYMPDGKVVPICVVEAPKAERNINQIDNMIFPSHQIGGGFPVIADVQKQEHIASIGCLVTDGHDVFALTNRHVVGAAGEVVYSELGGEKTRIGVSSEKQLTRKPFEEVYSEWPGKNVYIHLDIGLIKVDDKNRWSAKIFGIGQIGKLADLSMSNISLKLIGCPLRAYGCASGQMEGTIHGLFYRYKSVGGFEYVADFLIGHRKNGHPLKTRPGDSGTVWLLETQDSKAGLMPIAVQWGGQVFMDQGQESGTSYALATCLSTICNLLDVDIVRDWNIDQAEYWGEMGHYTVGAKACTIMSEPGLKKLMVSNADNIGFSDDILRDASKYKIHSADYPFVPLADVADDVWRNTRKSDENNHFADMDQPGGSLGKTLMEYYDQDPATLDIKFWSNYYDSINVTRPGALPFRVWQIYTAMVKYLKATPKPDIEHFLCAAGCLAHYVGDACQPLHISRLHHGFPPIKTGSVAYNVHSAYESTMLDIHRNEIVDGVNKALNGVHVTHSFTGGKGAAIRVIELMKWTIQNISPEQLVQTYNAGNSPSDRIDRMWNAYGQATIQSIAEGCKCLGEIWESAWEEGGGPSIPQGLLIQIKPKILSDIYRKEPDFIPSLALKNMGPLL